MPAGRPEDARTPVGTDRTTLSLAVRFTDAFTGGRPRTAPRVALVDRDESFVTNPSGFHVLTDLPTDVSSVIVDVDPGSRYLRERRDVDLEALDPSSPLETIDLFPAPAYRFPTGTTLVRGVLRDGAGDPLPDAELTVDGWPVETRSDDGGEFVLYLEGLTAADVSDDGKTVRIDGDDPTIVASHDELGTTSVTVPVAEGSTASVDVRF